jgi:hypothetical protein
MKRILLGVFLIIWFSSLAAEKASAQAEGYASEEETLYNGVLSIEYTCEGYGYFDDGSGEDYAGVSIGAGANEGCKIVDSNGSGTYQTTGTFYGNGSSTLYEPVTVTGNWQYYASFYIWMWDCDPDSEDCQGYPYIDYWGYAAYAGNPSQCPLNELYMGSGSDDWCYGPYSGDTLVTDYGNLIYAYAGSSPGNVGTFYVDALAIGISPSSYTVESGESATFTAEASNTGGFIPAYEWTLVSGPGGPATASGATYTYTAPAQVESGNTTATIKGCITNLTTTPVCQTVTVDLLAESITLDTPSPSILLADGQSTSSLGAQITNNPGNAVVTWTPTCPPSPGTACSIGNTSATYTAPASSATLFPGTGATPNVASVLITGTISGTSPAISNSASLTLVQPVSISGGLPTSLTAGTTTAVTITGAGFGTSPTVSVNNPNGGAFSGITFTPTGTPTNTQIQGNLFIPLNTVNIGATQPFTLTVSATTDGLTSTATSNSINIVPVAYTYTIALQVANPSLTYGYSTTVTPVMTCKVASTGSACSSTVFNAQTALASFSLTQNAAYGSLSSSTGSNQSPPTFTVAQLGSYPAPTVVVQACVTAPVPTAVCATTNFSIPVTSITLNPPTMAAPLAGGKTQAFTASIQNEGTATGLTWTLTPFPTSAAAGTLTSATTTITVQGSPTSGTSSNTYTAPATITSAAAVTLNVCMTANKNICATPVTIQLPGFSITATNNNPSQTALSLGHSMSYAISASALDGFNGTVVLSVSGLPAGVTAKLSAPSITTSTSGSVTLTLTSAYSTSTFIGNSTITVTGTSGSMAIPVSFALTTRPLQYAGQCGVPTTISRFYPNPLSPF